LIRFIQHIWELGFLLDSGKGHYGRGQEGKILRSTDYRKKDLSTPFPRQGQEYQHTEKLLQDFLYESALSLEAKSGSDSVAAKSSLTISGSLPRQHLLKSPKQKEKAKGNV
jgi:hypothetical protein